MNHMSLNGLDVGDLVWMYKMRETGIVVEPQYESESNGVAYVGVMIADMGGVVAKVRVDWCELLGRPIGSPSSSTPFSGQLMQGKAPNLQKFSSENFRNLSTLTIDEEVN